MMMRAKIPNIILRLSGGYLNMMKRKKLFFELGTALVLSLGVITASAANTQAGTVTIKDTTPSGASYCTGSISVYNGYGNGTRVLFPTGGYGGGCKLTVTEGTALIKSYAKSTAKTGVWNYGSTTALVGRPSVSSTTQYGVVSSSGSKSLKGSYTYSISSDTGVGLSATKTKSVTFKDGTDHPYADTTFTVK